MSEADRSPFDCLAAGRSPTLDSDGQPAPYDRGMAFLERNWLRRLRQSLLPLARGRVLEIGVGTGANLPFYPAGACVTAIDESAEMLAVAAGRRSGLPAPTSPASPSPCAPEQAGGSGAGLARMDVERLAFTRGAFDTVVGSLVLCSVVDQERALAEIRRVLRRPGGRLLLLEHMRPRVRPFAWLVDVANLPWCAINGRCHLNRETEAAIARAGFELERVDSRLGGFLRVIVARPT